MSKMRDIWGKKVGYKLDSLSMPIRFRTEEDRLEFGEFDLEEVLEERGYPVRDVEKEDLVTAAKGYGGIDGLPPKIISIGGKDYTLHRRWEYKEVTTEDGEVKDVEDYISGFIGLGGNALTTIGFNGVADFMRSLEDISYCTRIDIACDIAYRKESHTKLATEEFGLAMGWDINYEDKNLQNPDNRMGPGRKNKKSPISVSSQNKSNGVTTYVGGTESNFRIRAYNKQAEVIKKTHGTVDPGPLFRVELEAKRVNADAVRKYIIVTEYDEQETLKRLWHNVANDRISIKKSIGSCETENLGVFLGVGSATKLNLDYTKIEGDSMEYEAWVSKMVSPKFNRLENKEGSTPKERAKKWLGLSITDEMPEDAREYIIRLMNNLPDE